MRKGYCSLYKISVFITIVDSLAEDFDFDITLLVIQQGILKNLIFVVSLTTVNGIQFTCKNTEQGPGIAVPMSLLSWGWPPPPSFSVL